MDWESAAIWIALAEILGRRRLVSVMWVQRDAGAAWSSPPDRLARWAEPDPPPRDDPEETARLMARVGARRREVAAAVRQGRREALERALGHLSRLRSVGGRVACWPDYPDHLKHIPDPPAVLYLLGPLGLEPGPTVAIVGTRKPTGYGLAMADRLARDLAARGVVIVSGMAMGVDSAAHRAALAGGGSTVAVLATGVDVPYPRHETHLYRKVVERGLVLSEHPPGTPALPYRFPERNRLISGLSRAVVVVEGAIHSGARHTVEAADQQGRDTCAVPGLVSNPLAALPHHVIRTGAYLVRSAADVLDILFGPGMAPAGGQAGAPGSPAAGSGEEAVVLGWLGAGTHTASGLADALGLPPERVAATLTVLELRGMVRQLPGGWFVRT